MKYVIVIRVPDTESVSVAGPMSLRKARDTLRDLIGQDVVDEVLDNRIDEDEDPSVIFTNESGLPIDVTISQFHSDLAAAYSQIAP